MLMRFFLSIWCWVILSELRQTEFCKNYIVVYLNCYLNCLCQRYDAIPVPQGEEGEAYCPGVSVVKGKVIDLDDDWNSSEEATVSKKETIFQGISYDSIFQTIFILLCRRKSFSAELSVENERILWAMKRWEIENLMAVAAFCCILFEN